MQTISILVEGRTLYLKETKTTTCDDVIQYILNYNGLKENDKDPYILIVSDNITEKQLSRKAIIQKLVTELKLESNKIHFIMRKKTRIFMPKISIAKHRRLRKKSLTTVKKVENDPSTPLDTSKYTQVRKASEQIRGVKRLYELVRVQKRHLSEVYQKLNGTAKFIKQTIRKKSIQSDDLDTSLDQFLKDVNKESMQGFLNFCDVVATKELEKLSSALTTSMSVNRSVMEDRMRFKLHIMETKHVDYTNKKPLVNENSLFELNNAFKDVTNDALMLDDELHSRVHGEGSFAKMVLPPSRRRIIAGPNRIGWNKEPLHCTPLANKTMSYLNKSLNSIRMKRQFASSRLPQDLLTNRTEQEMPKCDSSLHRGPDGDLSMFIYQRKFAFSSQEDKCKFFWEQSNGSDSDDSLDRTLSDNTHGDDILNTKDGNKKVSADSSSSNVLSSKVVNNRDHLVLKFDRNPREFPPMQDVQEDARDDSTKANFKMRLVNYRFSDADISTLTCESVGMSCDCKKTPCATFTRDYVTIFWYSPEFE
ncbi:hypothetical protein ACJMK2_020722 [Sinanodonta woodiana]|uniref:Ras-associating domain-containing protein n=1 Tax=Sinanodonta woodiana TaxID=1069815 RepID=A0ABD3U024_SINWO